MLFIKGIYLLLSHLPTSHTTVRAVRHTAVSCFYTSRYVTSCFLILFIRLYCAGYEIRSLESEGHKTTVRTPCRCFYTLCFTGIHNAPCSAAPVLHKSMSDIYLKIIFIFQKLSLPLQIWSIYCHSLK